jgi:ZIP family zinc transporter
MELTRQPPQPQSWRDYARTHAIAGTGLGLAVLFVLGLLIASIVQVFTGEAKTNINYALLGGVAGFTATAVGALPGLLLRGIRARVEDSMLGFAAGMMLAASSFSLIIPGLEAGKLVAGSAVLGGGLVVLGMALGVLLMLGLDEFIPHQHENSAPCGPGSDRINRIWLFVLAIALHNVPEGMAIGVSFSHGDLTVGLPLTAAIALQDIPEGLAVALALRSAGLAPLSAVLIAAGSGALEPLGALLGIGLTSGLAAAYPIGLGLAAGAMIFVVSHEVIPETHRNGHQTPATLGLMGGFALMMILDTTLG